MGFEGELVGVELGGGGGRGTYIIEVDVDAAEVGENEVADGVRALDGLGVVVEGVQEPGVFGGYELA